MSPSCLHAPSVRQGVPVCLMSFCGRRRRHSRAVIAGGAVSAVAGCAYPYANAATCHQRALATYRAVGDRASQAGVLNSLSELSLRLAETDIGRRYHAHAPPFGLASRGAH